MKNREEEASLAGPSLLPGSHCAQPEEGALALAARAFPATPSLAGLLPHSQGLGSLGYHPPGPGSSYECPHQEGFDEEGHREQLGAETETRP